MFTLQTTVPLDVKSSWGLEFSEDEDYFEAPGNGFTNLRGTITTTFKYLKNAGGRIVGHVYPRDEWQNRLFIGTQEIDGKTYFYIGLGDTWDLDMEIFQIQPGQWYTTTLTFDGGSYSVYKEGVLVSSGTYSGFDNFSGYIDFGNGARIDQRDRSPPCVMKNLQLWNRALDPSEVAFYHKSRLTGREKNLVGYWLNGSSSLATRNLVSGSSTANNVGGRWVRG